MFHSMSLVLDSVAITRGDPEGPTQGVGVQSAHAGGLSRLEQNTMENIRFCEKICTAYLWKPGLASESGAFF